MEMDEDKLKEKLRRVDVYDVICIILAVFFAFAATFQALLAIAGDTKVDYTFFVENVKNPEALGAEVRIHEIKITGTPYDLNQLSDYGLMQEDGTLVLSPYEQNVEFTIETGIFDTVTIELLKHPWSGILHVSNGEQEYSVDLYSDSSTVTTENYQCENTTKYILTTAGSHKKAIVFQFALFFLLGLIGFWLVHLFLARIEDHSFRWWMIPLICIDLFILGIFSVYGCLYISPVASVGIILLLTGYCLFRIRKVLSSYLENVYIVIALIYGISMLLILPIGHVPDEFAHEAKCYAMAEAYTNTQDEVYVLLPKEANEALSFFSQNIMYIDLKYSPVDILSWYKNPVNFTGDQVVMDSRNTIPQNEFAYLPATLIVMLAHVIPTPAILIFQLGRLINFIIGTILFYFAIKNTPCFKRIFFMIALFPITIQQTAAINQDWITNAVVFLFAALSFQYALEKESITFTDYCKLLILSICLGLIKLAYFPIALLVLLIPNKSFGAILDFLEAKKKKNTFLAKIHSGILNRNRIAFTLKCFVILLGFVLAIAQGLPTYLSGEAHLTDCNVFTLHMVLEQPLRALKLCWNTFHLRGTLDFCDGLLNGFGWSIKWTSGITRSLVMMSALFLVLTNREEEHPFTWRQKPILLCSMLGMWGMTYAALLTGWTEASATSIAGLQSRYFIPIALLVYILFHNKTFQNQSKRINTWFTAFAVIALTVGMNTLACGYYRL